MPLPTYRLVDFNEDEEWADIEIPDADIPHEHATDREWLAHLNERYQEHAGTFKVKRI